tara:strand:- start:2406 stop:2768 length:363 start_codon:yes stop_codon:yes gene_type:complete
VIDSREKGKSGEREAAAILSELFGVPVRRSQQYSGAAGDADLVGLPGVHVEVKRRERGNVANWIEQAMGDAVMERVPLVVHRQNGRPWLATCCLEDLPDLVCKLYLTLSWEPDETDEEDE